MKGSLKWTKPAGSLEGGADSDAADGKLREVTDEFIRIEKEGIKDYKTLIGESSDYYHGLFKVLMDSMIRDSEKQYRAAGISQRKLESMMHRESFDPLLDFAEIERLVGKIYLSFFASLYG